MKIDFYGNNKLFGIDNSKVYEEYSYLKEWLSYGEANQLFRNWLVMRAKEEHRELEAIEDYRRDVPKIDGRVYITQWKRYRIMHRLYIMKPNDNDVLQDIKMEVRYGYWSDIESHRIIEGVIDEINPDCPLNNKQCLPKEEVMMRLLIELYNDIKNGWLSIIQEYNHDFLVDTMTLIILTIGNMGIKFDLIPKVALPGIIEKEV